MIWRMFLPERPAIATQAVVKAVDGGGSFTLTGVVSFDTKDQQLIGRNAAGCVTMVVPLSQVAAAVIDEVKDGG